jgi:hypothetical protein
LLNLSVVLLAEFVGGADGDVECRGDGAAAFAFGAEVNDLVDDVLGSA